ncbi:MAG: acyltransferase, partial [Proteobacteria bacterium]
MLMLGLSISAILYRFHKGSLLQEASTRFVSIDGLRGYLAFAVYLHHSCIWYFYLQTGRWEVPPSSLYTMLGQGAVALFFMVTSFLFATKILYSKANRIDWFGFYILRAARLV